jgi:hypothetical protein
MEKPIFRQENLLQIHFSIGTDVLMFMIFTFMIFTFMIFDFSCTCKTNSKDIYKKESFINTSCPKCPAIGRFNLHGSYSRYVAYFEKFELVHKLMDVKRIKCLSCKSTHAVMPGDLIPYRLLSLFVVIFILASVYLKRIPVLKISDVWNFSFQFVYTVIYAFRMHISRIHQYFNETVYGTALFPIAPGQVLALIQKPYISFQSGYTKLNRRPCFMCKFFNRGGAPPIGIMAAGLPSGGQQHNL